MRTTHARFALSAVLAAQVLLTTPGHARSDGQAIDVGAPATDATVETDGLTTGTINLTPAEKRARRFEDCMSIWEPATHMTKRQWRRTCKSQLDEEPSL